LIEKRDDCRQPHAGCFSLADSNHTDAPFGPSGQIQTQQSRANLLELAYSGVKMLWHEMAWFMPNALLNVPRETMPAPPGVGGSSHHGIQLGVEFLEMGRMIREKK